MDRPAIIETGSGNSSIAFLLAGPARLVSIDPDRRILERIAAFCDAKAIDRKCHEVILERSEPALARLAADPANSFDIALIDGGHGWPTVFVDFCFMNAMLRRGGFLILDDTQLHSVAEVASWLREQPQFELAETHPKTLVFRKKSDEHFMPDWGGQPYIVRRSKA
jgi:predicted O-methyltransferase YrrM